MANNPVVHLPPVEAVEAEEIPQPEQGVQAQRQDLQVQARQTLEQSKDGLLSLTSAELLVNSGILPKTINTAEKAIAIALNGRDLGISPTVAFNNIWLLDGKPSLSAGLVTALANRAGLRFNWLRDKADVIGPLYDAQGNVTGEGVVDWAWEVEMMERWGNEVLKNRMALLWSECVASGWTGKDPWKKHPRAMARARLIVQIIRAHRPDVLMGMTTFEELADGRSGEQYKYDPDNNRTVLL